MSHCYLDDLPPEVLLKIFSYLKFSDLCRLKQTCKSINEFISIWDHVLLKDLNSLVTNQRNQTFLSRCMKQLSALEKIRISKNWVMGKYTEKSLLFVNKKYIPWLHLSKRYVWLSRGKNIYCYERTNGGVNTTRPHYILHGHSQADIVNFQLKDDFLVSGHRDGSMWLKNIKTKSFIFDKSQCHPSDINSVDISRNGCIIASGCRDNFLNTWTIKNGNSEIVQVLQNNSADVLEQTYSCRLLDRVWKVALLDEGSQLAVGTSGNQYRCALLVLDMERLQHTFLPSSSQTRGTEDWGILDLKWDGPQTLWSCGYDTYLRRWDLRSGSCVQIFPDPHASALYCLDYDFHNTVMVGTQMYGRVILWDVRQIKCVQLYFMNSCRNLYNRHQRSSPIYSLAFDSEFLFTATDQNLNVLNFSGYNGKVNDYSQCLIDTQPLSI